MQYVCSGSEFFIVNSLSWATLGLIAAGRNDLHEVLFRISFKHRMERERDVHKILAPQLNIIIHMMPMCAYQYFEHSLCPIPSYTPHTLYPLTLLPILIPSYPIPSYLLHSLLHTLYPLTLYILLPYHLCILYTLLPSIPSYPLYPLTLSTLHTLYPLTHFTPYTLLPTLYPLNHFILILYTILP